MKLPVILALLLIASAVPLQLAVGEQEPQRELPWFLTDMRPPLNPPPGFVMPTIHHCGRDGSKCNIDPESFPDFTKMTVSEDELFGARCGEGGRTTYPQQYNFSLDVSFEWDATTAQFQDMEGGLRMFSALVYDYTDGQAYVGRFDIWNNKANWNTADIHVLNIPNYRANANLGGIWYGGIINVGKDAWGGPWTSGTGAVIFGHEFGHYGFALPDEYDDQTGTHCDNAGAGTCIMSNPYSEFELCTDASHNAAATGISTSCWHTLKANYPAVTQVQGNPDSGPNSAPPITVKWHFPDLEIRSSEISVIPGTGLNEGDNITVMVPVHNIDRLLSSTIKFNLYYDTINSANLIGTTNLAVGGQESATASMLWAAKGGTHSLIGVADPDNTIKEATEGNNQGSKQVVVNNRPKISSTLSSFTSKEDVSLSVKMTSFATDTEDAATALKWSVTGFDSHHISSVSGQNNPNQTLTFNPVANWFGTTTVTLAVSDTKNLIAKGTAQITFSSVNDLPVASNLALSVLSVKRNDTAELFADGRDVEDKTMALVPFFEWKSPNGDWTQLQGSYDGSRFTVSLPVPVTAGLGKADARLCFADTMGTKGDWEYLNASLELLNNAPTVIDLGTLRSTVTRGDSVTLVMNASDPETQMKALAPVLEYRTLGGDWKAAPANSSQFTNDRWEFLFEPDANTTVGLCDFRVSVKDTDGSRSELLESDSMVDIQNSLPTMDYVKINRSKMARLDNATVTLLGMDLETRADSFDVEVRAKDSKGREQLTFTKNAKWANNSWEVRFSPPAGAALGKYDIEARVRDADGGWSEWLASPSKIDVTNNAPRALFTGQNEAQEGDLVWFDASASRDAENPSGDVTFTWNFGDGGIGSGQKGSHVFKPGTFKVTLIITDKDGATATAEKSITIKAKPFGGGGFTAAGGGPNILLILLIVVLIAGVVGAGVYMSRRKKRAKPARAPRKEGRAPPRADPYAQESPAAVPYTPPPSKTHEYGGGEMTPAYAPEPAPVPAYQLDPSMQQVPPAEPYQPYQQSSYSHPEAAPYPPQRPPAAAPYVEARPYDPRQPRY